MRIGSGPVDQTQTSVLTAAQSGQAAAVETTQPATGVKLTQPQLELLLDTQIRSLLSEIGKALGTGQELVGQLPKAAADTLGSRPAVNTPQEAVQQNPAAAKPEGDAITPKSTATSQSIPTAMAEGASSSAGTVKDDAATTAPLPGRLMGNGPGSAAQMPTITANPGKTSVPVPGQVPMPEETALPQGQVQGAQSAKMPAEAGGTGASRAGMTVGTPVLAEMKSGLPAVPIRGTEKEAVMNALPTALAESEPSPLSGLNSLAKGMSALLGDARQTAVNMGTLIRQLDTAATLKQALGGPLPEAAAKLATSVANSLTGFEDTFSAEFFSRLGQLGGGGISADSPLVATLRRDAERVLAAKQGFAELPPALRQALEQMVPESARNFAAANQMPELKEAAMLLRLREARDYLHLPSSTLEHASGTLKEVSGTMQRLGAPQTSATQDQVSLSFSTAIYFGEEKKPFPVYIHISRDKEQEGSGSVVRPRDTWMRVCTMTENLGLADIVFHLYGKDQLSVRVNLGDAEAAEQLRAELPGIRARLADSPFTLTEFSIMAQPAPLRQGG